MLYHPQPTQPPPRPTGFITLMLLFMLHQIGTILHALQIPSEIAQSLSLSPLLQMLAAGFWTLIFAQSAISLWQRKKNAANRAFLQGTVFIVYSVLRLFIFTQSDYDRQRLPFLLALTLLFAVLLRCTRAFKTRRQHRSDGHYGQ